MKEAEFFDATGYLRVMDAVPDEVLARMQDVIEREFLSKAPPLRINERGEVARIDRLLERDPVFLEALRSREVLRVLRLILGPVIEVVRHRHNHATMNCPGDIPFRLHRDIQQWSQPLVSVFFYFEDAVVANGCTVVVPATHRLPYAGPQSHGGGGNWADEHPEYRTLIGQELPVEVPRGGVLILNSLAFHSVGRGTGDRSRKSCVFALRAVDELRATYDEESAVMVTGRPRNLSNDVLRVSGSLAKG